ncbi:MAG: M28 family peptidase, partial [Acidobacteriota bacterium]
RHFRNADHVHFFLRGIPTLYFYGGGEAYHQPDDDPERLNYPKVAKMAGVLALLVQESDSWGS